MFSGQSTIPTLTGVAASLALVAALRAQKRLPRKASASMDLDAELELLLLRLRQVLTQRKADEYGTAHSVLAWPERPEPECQHPPCFLQALAHPNR